MRLTRECSLCVQWVVGTSVNRSPRDQMLAQLHRDLLQVRVDMKELGSDLQVEALSTREWTFCLRTVEESIQRHSTGPGSQGYLTFLEGFIPSKR